MSGYSPILELGDDPITPREKVEQAVRAASRGQWTGGVRVGSAKWCNGLTDAILTALASVSGDHAELINLLRWGQKDPLGDGGTYIVRNPDGRKAADALEALLAESAALRADLAKTGRDFSELRDSYDRVSNKLCVERAHGGRETKRATEAERKLAEAVGVVEWYGENARLARLIHSEGDAGRNALADDGGKRARTFLSKEAERG